MESSPFLNLPAEIKLHILSDLTAKDIVRARQVCRDVHTLKTYC